jgi:hypothetical protein
MTKYNLINLVDDAVLNNKKSYFSVVLPDESVNLVFDPETNDIDNFTITGTSTIALTDEETCYGNYSINVNPFILNDTLEYTLLIPLEDATHYTFSISIKGRGTFALYIVDSTDVIIGGKTVIETYDFWNRYSHTILCTQNHNLLSAPPYSNAKLIVEALEDDLNIFVSGYQLEPKSYATTFLSGNLKGLQPLNDNSYLWSGQPHKSISVRLGNTNTGGKIISFEEMGFDITTIEGLLLPDFEHNTQELLDSFNILYYGSKIKAREFSLGGLITGKNLYIFLNRLNQLSNAFNPATNRSQQPIKLLLQLYDCDTPITEVMEILALYNGGIDEFNSTNGMAASIDFTMFTPFIYDSKWNARHLDLTATGSGHPIIRDQNGNWNDYEKRDINTMIIGQDNLLWAGMDSIGADEPMVVKLVGNVWVTVAQSSPTLDGSVYALHRSRDGNYIYIGGQFGGLYHPTIPANDAIVSSASDTMNFGRYNVALDDFEYIGKTNAGGTVYCFEELITGEILIGGNFDQVTSIAAVNTTVSNVAVFNPFDNTLSKWYSDLTQNGIGDPSIGEKVLTIKYDPFRNRTWFGGLFDGLFNNAGILLENVVSFSDTNYPTATVDGTTEGLNDEVHSIVIDSKGTLYIGGFFTAGEDYYTFGANTFTTTEFNNRDFAPSVARLYEKEKDFWRWEFIGATFQTDMALTAGLGEWGEVLALAIDSQDQLWIGGRFDWVGDYATVYATDIDDALKLHTHNTNGLAVYSNNQWITNPGISLDYFFGGGVYAINRVKSMVIGKLGFKYNSYTATGSSFVNTDYIDVVAINPHASDDYTYTPATFITLPESTIACKPIIEIVGPGDLISIENATTRQIIYFNKNVALYETLIIDLSGLLPTMYSTIYGYQNQNIIRNASVLKKFILHAGRNTFFVRFNPNTTNGNTSVAIKWQNRYLSFDNIIHL